MRSLLQSRRHQQNRGKGVPLGHFTSRKKENNMYLIYRVYKIFHKRNAWGEVTCIFYISSCGQCSVQCGRRFQCKTSPILCTALSPQKFSSIFLHLKMFSKLSDQENEVRNVFFIFALSAGLASSYIACIFFKN